MKILQLCLRVPYPPNDGATIAMYNLADSLLHHRAQLKVLAFNTSKNYIEKEKYQGAFASQTALETVDLDLRIKPAEAFFHLFSGESYNIRRFCSAAFSQKLAHILRNEIFDVIQLEGLYMTPYLDDIRRHSRARVVLRAHNVEHVIWERMAAACRNFLKRKYFYLLAKRLKQYEKEVLNRLDAILPITPVDEAIFKALGGRVPMLVVPAGIRVADYDGTIPGAAGFSVFHLGSMDWMPNLEGVDWFLDSVLPCLRQSIPGLTVVLAGKNMPQRIKDKADAGLRVLDRISDSKEFIRDKTVMVVPLLSGGGIRVKIIEGMAAGKAIVSTTVGAEGIRVTNGKDILIADTALEFCRAIIKLHQDPRLCSALGQQARQLASENYDSYVLGGKLMEFYRSLLYRA